jgi:hypothetical protein
MLIKLINYTSNKSNSTGNNDTPAHKYVSVFNTNRSDAYCFSGKQLALNHFGTVVKPALPKKQPKIKYYRYDDPTKINVEGDLTIHLACRNYNPAKIKYIIEKASQHKGNHFETILLTPSKEGINLIDYIIKNKDWNSLNTLILSLDNKPELSSEILTKLFKTKLKSPLQYYDQDGLLIQQIIIDKQEETAINIISSLKKYQNTLADLLNTPNIFNETALHMSIENGFIKLSNIMVASLQENNQIEMITTKNMNGKSPLYLAFDFLASKSNLMEKHEALSQQINDAFKSQGNISIRKDLIDKKKLYKIDPELIKETKELINQILYIYKKNNNVLIKNDLENVTELLKRNPNNWTKIDQDIKNKFNEVLSIYSIQSNI